jgi:nucleotide-binding universal stress UspA family protein
MDVIAAVNGQVTSEVAALYGLHFARIHGLPLVLLHVKNPADTIDLVESSMANIEKSAAAYDLSCSRVMLEGHPIDAVKQYLLKNRSEIIFCSTRYRKGKRLLHQSFSEKLRARPLPVDLAEVRVVHVNSTLSTERIVLPIREDRLSAEKFTFFASMAKAYQASGEIYSVTVTNRKKRASLELGDIKRRLQKIDDRLSHYEKLAELLDIPLRLKHAIAANEINQVLHHLSHNDFNLMIVGGERLSAYSALTRSKPIERLQRATPVNTIAFYLRGKTR